MLVGEGGTLELDASPSLIHPQITLAGSWVTTIGHMEDLIADLVAWDLHPDMIVSDTFALPEAAAAYERADSGVAQKVGFIWE